MGTTVKRKRVSLMLRFSEYALTGVILYLTFKKQKNARALIWRKTAILFSTDGPIFTKLLKVDSLTLNRYKTAEVGYHRRS